MKYYDKRGAIVGEAHSIMPCKDYHDAKPHKAHVHNSELFLYGPYVCAGEPPILLYDTPLRRPVNPQAINSRSDQT